MMTHQIPVSITVPCMSTTQPNFFGWAIRVEIAVSDLSKLNVPTGKSTYPTPSLQNHASLLFEGAQKHFYLSWGHWLLQINFSSHFPTKCLWDLNRKFAHNLCFSQLWLSSVNIKERAQITIENNIENYVVLRDETEVMIMIQTK